MGFVYAGALWLGRAWVFENVPFILGAMPKHSIVDGREVQILGDASDPCWDSLQAFM